jgi:hypothetical protein
LWEFENFGGERRLKRILWWFFWRGIGEAVSFSTELLTDSKRVCWCSFSFFLSLLFGSWEILDILVANCIVLRSDQWAKLSPNKNLDSGIRVVYKFEKLLHILFDLAKKVKYIRFFAKKVKYIRFLVEFKYIKFKYF